MTWLVLSKIENEINIRKRAQFQGLHFNEFVEEVYLFQVQHVQCGVWLVGSLPSVFSLYIHYTELHMIHVTVFWITVISRVQVYVCCDRSKSLRRQRAICGLESNNNNR